jgi:transcriptional regulator with XRE-family HTH domain
MEVKMNDFSECLTTYIRAAGITQKELADEAAVHAATVNRWAKGRVRPAQSSLDAIIRIAGVLQSKTLRAFFTNPTLLEAYRRSFPFLSMIRKS